MASSTNCIKLLAAGCVVGVLAGAAVQAETYDPYEEDSPMYDAYGNPIDEYTDAYDPYADDPAYDDAYAPEPAEDAEDEEDEEADEPEEVEEVADAPDAVDEDDGTTSPFPDEDALADLGYFFAQGVDYIPGPDKLVAAVDLDMILVADATECAEACEDVPECNAAAYITEDFPLGFNCWMKSLAVGCTVPEDTDDLENGGLLMSDNRCEVDVTAEVDTAAAPLATAAVASGEYTQYAGFDYIPESVTGTATLVTVTDVLVGTEEGAAVETIEECEALCDTTATCNALSYYVEELPPFGFNCFLKVLGDSCALPSDAIEDANAVLSLRCDDGVVSLSPAAAVAPTTVADAPTTTDDRDLGTTTTTTTDETTTTVDDTDGASALFAGFTTVAAVAAVALF